MINNLSVLFLKNGSSKTFSNLEVSEPEIRLLSVLLRRAVGANRAQHRA